MVLEWFAQLFEPFGVVQRRVKHEMHGEWRGLNRPMRNESRKAVFEDHLLRALPDVVLPSQFFESVGAQTLSSEQRLMLAVLANAINILRDYRVSPSNRKLSSFNEAASWVFADGIEGPMSFDQVCDALGVNAESLRRRLSEVVLQQGGNLLRMRLKEGGRMQCMAVNRRRVRRRAHLGSSGCAD